MVQSFYRVNSPEVVSETIDGEVVIVNLEKGHYYSLVKTGAYIWNKIEKGISSNNLMVEILNKYDGNTEDIQKSVSMFLQQLKRMELIVEDTDNLENTNNSNGIAQINSSQEKTKFEPPSLETYTDMEELLLLDPIHEVDEEAGWPNMKAEAA